MEQVNKNEILEKIKEALENQIREVKKRDTENHLSKIGARVALVEAFLDSAKESFSTSAVISNQINELNLDMLEDLYSTYIQTLMQINPYTILKEIEEETAHETRH